MCVAILVLPNFSKQHIRIFFIISLVNSTQPSPIQGSLVANNPPEDLAFQHDI